MKLFTQLSALINVRLHTEISDWRDEDAMNDEFQRMSSGELGAKFKGGELFDDDEVTFLKDLPEKVHAQIGRINRSITSRQYAGGLKVDPAIVSRVFQELSNAMAAFHGAVKIKEIPVPFALVHVQMILLWMFNTFSPVSISIFVINFLECDQPSGEGFSLPVECSSGEIDGKFRPAMTRTHMGIAMASRCVRIQFHCQLLANRLTHPLAPHSFIVVAGFTAMWLAANELEDPFGKGAPAQ